MAIIIAIITIGLFFFRRHPTLCNNVLISNITIKSGQFDDAPEYSGHNVDGCDPDSCTNVVFENSLVHAGVRRICPLICPLYYHISVYMR